MIRSQTGTVVPGADLDRIREHVTELPHPYPGKEPAPAAGPNQLWLAAGAHDVAASERSRGDALTLIGERLTAIERRLGISGQSPPDPRDEQIAEVRRAKEAAINGGELEKAAALSDQEKRLNEQKEASAREQWLRAEIARLQALLRRHGIDLGIDQGNPASVD